MVGRRPAALALPLGDLEEGLAARALALGLLGRGRALLGLGEALLGLLEPLLSSAASSASGDVASATSTRARLANTSSQPSPWA